ncbi:MAG TPA: glutathione S-transferase N-terminal domain-containing protein [Steroidobacteraceae bacterium]
MTLYSRSDDPRCQRVRIVLAEKELDVRIVEVDAARPPEDLIDLNPYQTLPTLVDRDLVVYDAGIICEYIDERFPHPGLMPADPAARAHARVALRRVEQEWYLVADELVRVERRDRDRVRKALAESILASEPLFRMRAWFLSDQFSLLDAAIAPILWRLADWGVDLGGNAPGVERYGRKVFGRASFQASLTPRERDARRLT